MTFLIVFFRLARAYLFYPAVIALMIWLWVKDAHWGWGLLVLLAILILDPIWGIIGRRIFSWRPHKPKNTKK